MKYIDLHCDTASVIYNEKLSLKKSKCKVDEEKLLKGGALAQFFAFFINLSTNKDPYDEFKKMYNNFMNEINQKDSRIKKINSVNQLESLGGKVGAILTIEEGEVLKGDIKKVREMYDLGIRCITLTWNYENSLGYPNYKFKYKNNGLKELGKEIVLEMEKVGIIPDASHLSDGGFYDLIKICKKPFIATHSNSREIMNHPRNLSDDMIKALANKGGVMGINFCNDFVYNRDKTMIEDLLTHIKHIRNVGGIEVLSIGSDFDGIENEVEIEDTSEMNKLYFALRNIGFNDDDIEKIFYKNIIRVLKEHGGE